MYEEADETMPLGRHIWIYKYIYINICMQPKCKTPNSCLLKESGFSLGQHLMKHHRNIMLIYFPGEHHVNKLTKRAPEVV